MALLHKKQCMTQKNKLLFENEPFYNEFLIPIKNSTPTKSDFLELKFESDFDLGIFVLNIKDKNFKHKITFTKNEINNFWEMVEILTNSSEALFLRLFYLGFETMLYLKGDEEIRFLILDTKNLDEKVKNKKLINYSYSQSEIKLDILINKKLFISLIYKKMYELFKNFENIAYFEPPLIDFNYWKKDSEIIRAFLKIKN